MITFAPAGASASPLMSWRRTPGAVAACGTFQDSLDSLVNELSFFCARTAQSYRRNFLFHDRTVDGSLTRITTAIVAVLSR
jgi:hypothetical protein